jgi:hypothetical protein
MICFDIREGFEMKERLFSHRSVVMNVMLGEIISKCYT